MALLALCMCDVVSLLLLCGFLLSCGRGLCLVTRVAMGKQHQQIHRAMHVSQQKVSEQSAVSIPSYYHCLYADL